MKISTAWRSRTTGMWLVEVDNRSHTKRTKTHSETDDLQKATLMVIPDMTLRDICEYEPIQVSEKRVVEIL